MSARYILHINVQPVIMWAVAAVHKHYDTSTNLSKNTANFLWQNIQYRI